MSALRVSLVQRPLAWQDGTANRAHFGELLRPLAGHTDLVVLPETFTTDFSMEVERLGEPPGGETSAWLVQCGRTLADAGDAPTLLTVHLPREPLIALREKFPAHLDADRFTLEP